MNSRIIGIIVRREYLNRVKKKSFLVTTFLVPVLFAAMCLLPSLIQSVIRAIDGWAVCDTVCGAARWADSAKCDRQALWYWLGRMWGSVREFEVRFAVIMSMSHFLEEKWLPQIFGMTDSLDFTRVESAYLPYQTKSRRTVGKAAQAESDVLVRSGLGYVLPEGRSGRAPGAARGALPPAATVP